MPLAMIRPRAYPRKQEGIDNCDAGQWTVASDGSGTRICVVGDTDVVAKQPIDTTTDATCLKTQLRDTKKRKYSCATMIGPETPKICVDLWATPVASTTTRYGQCKKPPSEAAMDLQTCMKLKLVPAPRPGATDPAKQLPLRV